MRRLTCGWAMGLTAALLTTSARAQLLPAPVAPAIVVPVTPPKVSAGHAIKPVTKTQSTASQAVKSASLPPMTGAPVVRQVTTINGAPSLKGLTASSPLLSAPLGTGRTAATTGFTPNLRTPGTRDASEGQPIAGPRGGLSNLLSLRVAPTAAGEAALVQARGERLSSLVTSGGGRLEKDPAGNPVIRGHVLLIDPDSQGLERLLSHGFRILSDERDPWLALRAVTLSAPSNLSATVALREVHSMAPRLTADYDHVYEPAGGALGAVAGPLAQDRAAGGLTIGMIDGGVAAHPALARRIVEQRGFAGAARPTGHGTAVASLLAGNDGRFHGAAGNASLLVADVYGGQSGTGSASRIVQALDWLASKRPAVINISLVGPDNALLRRAIMAVRQRGIPVVAAVGNDGPAAPPQYPASYAGVVSVTGVDSRGVALFESGTATHLDFAAPGADMAAARPGHGYARVRGTSFAAPLAAGRLAQAGSVLRLAAEARPGKGRVGRGIVCSTCRIDPKAVGAI